MFFKMLPAPGTLRAFPIRTVPPVDVNPDILAVYGPEKFYAFAEEAGAVGEKATRLKELLQPIVSVNSKFEMGNVDFSEALKLCKELGPWTNEIKKMLTQVQQQFNRGTLPFGSQEKLKTLANKLIFFRLDIGGYGKAAIPAIMDGLQQALDAKATGYTRASGQKSLVDRLAEEIKKDWKVAYNSSSEICVVPGGSPAIYLALKTVIQPYDKVLSPNPAYPKYEKALKEFKADVGYYTYEQNDFGSKPSLDFDKIRSAAEGCKVFLLNNPHNPTGHCLTMDECESLARLAKEMNFLVVADAAYEKVRFQEEPAYIVEAFRNMGAIDHILYTATTGKPTRSNGLRIGYCTGHPSYIELISNQAKVALSCPSSVGQAAIEFAMDFPEQWQENSEILKTSRDVMCDVLKDIPDLGVYKPDGAFYFWMDFSKIMEKKGIGPTQNHTSLENLRLALMTEAGLHGVIGDFYGSPTHLRLAFAKLDPDQLVEAANRLKRWVEGKPILLDHF